MKRRTIRNLMLSLLTATIFCGYVLSADISTTKKPIRRGQSYTMNISKSENHVIWFSTTIVANVNTLLLGTMTVTGANFPDGVNFSTVPTHTMGGRVDAFFGVVESAGNIHWSKVDGMTTSTSPYLAEGDGISFGSPVNYQGPVWIRGVTSATVAGYLMFEQPYK